MKSNICKFLFYTISLCYLLACSNKNAQNKNMMNVNHFINIPNELEGQNNVLNNNIAPIAFQNINDNIFSNINVNKKNNNIPILHSAILSNNTAKVKSLLQNPDINVNIKDIDNNKPLHISIEEENLNIFKLLINRNDINIDAQGKNNQTPLHLSVKKGFYLFVKLLLEKGADPLLKDNLDNLPQDLTNKNSNIYILLSQYMVKKTKSNSLNFENNKIDKSDLLIKNKDKINQKQKSQWKCEECDTYNSNIFKYCTNCNIINQNKLIDLAEEKEIEIDLFINNNQSSEEPSYIEFDDDDDLARKIELINNKKAIKNKLDNNNIHDSLKINKKNIEISIFNIDDDDNNDIDNSEKEEEKLSQIDFNLSSSDDENESLENNIIKELELFSNKKPPKIKKNLFRNNFRNKKNKLNTNISKIFNTQNNELFINYEIESSIEIDDDSDSLSSSLISISRDIKQKKSIINFIDFSNYNQLIKNGDLDGFNLLIKQDNTFDVNNLDKNKENLLFKACKYGHLNFVTRLIELNADKLIHDKKLNNLVAISAKNLNLDILKYLKETTPFIFDTKNIDGNTPLHLAADKEFCKNKNLETVRYLVSTNLIDINKRNNNRETPLSLSYKNIETFKCLLENNADYNIKTKYGWLPLYSASIMGYFAIVDYIISDMEKKLNDNNKDKYYEKLNIALVCSCFKPYKIIAEYLLNKGANINYLCKIFNNKSYHIKHASILEKISSNLFPFLNSKEFIYSIYPISAAAISQDNNFIKFLISQDANINLKNKFEISPVQYAICTNKYDIVKTFFDKGVHDNIRSLIDLDILNNLNNDNEIINLKLSKFLFSKLWLIDTLNKNGETILHQLCDVQNRKEIQKRLDLIKYLVEERNADIKIKNKYKKTAIKKAKENKLTEIKEYFSKKNSLFSLFKR